MPDFSYEEKYHKQDLIVAGCDEAGRGPLAGPVIGTSVIIFDKYSLPNGINDSKKLSELKREKLYELLINSEIEYQSVAKDNHYIDDNNILKSSIDAMNEAALNLKPVPDFLLVDGNRFSSNFQYETIVKGDSISLSIAAASIIAKVTRDRLLREMEKEYPMFNFSRHKGYPTKAHYEEIRKHGLTKYHRKSFLSSFSDKQLNFF